MTAPSARFAQCPRTAAVVDEEALRHTMGRFATGVAVVTTLASDEPHGMTVNSLTSVSLEPPLILVSLAADTRTNAAISASGRFAVSIVSARQQEIALRFAKRGLDHFAGLPVRMGDHAVPIVPGALAHIECTTHLELPAGDHTLFVGRVVRTCARDGRPLVFHGGSFTELDGREPDPAEWLF